MGMIFVVTSSEDGAGEITVSMYLAVSKSRFEPLHGTVTCLRRRSTALSRHIVFGRRRWPGNASNAMEGKLPPRKHHIHLTYEQRRELKQVVRHDTAARGRRARALLLADEGLHGPGLTFVEVGERVGLQRSTVASLVIRANQTGPKEAAAGLTSDRGGGRPPAFTPEQEDMYREQFATGAFTKAELARRSGVHESTIGRIIGKDQDPERRRR